MIIEYGAPINKWYLLCSGHAKEFVAKTENQILKETQTYQQKLEDLNSLMHANVESNNSPTGKSPTKRAPKNFTSAFKEEMKYSSRSKLQDGDSPGRGETNKSLGITNSKGSPDHRSRNRALHPSMGMQDAFELCNEYEVNRGLWEALKRRSETYFSGDILKIRFLRFCTEGDCFGLVSLDGAKSRSSAVIASENCYCISLQKDELIKIVQEEKALYGYKVEFFRGLFPEAARSAVVDFSLYWEEHYYQANDVLFKQGEYPNFLYVLISGEVVLSKGFRSNENETITQEDSTLPVVKRKTLTDLNVRVVRVCDGSFFGEEDFFKETSREFTATVCSLRARILRLDRQSYATLLENSDEVIQEIKDKTMSKFQFNKKRLEDLYEQKVPHRDTPADSYINLKDNIFSVLVNKNNNNNNKKTSGNASPIPKLNLYHSYNSVNKKQSNANKYDVVAELQQKHPKLMEFITQKQLKYSKNRLKLPEPQTHNQSPVLQYEKIVNPEFIEDSEDWIPFIKSRKSPVVGHVNNKGEESGRWGQSNKSIEANSQPDDIDISRSIIYRDISHNKEVFPSRQSLAKKTLKTLTVKSTNHLSLNKIAQRPSITFKNRNTEVRKYLNKVKDVAGREQEILPLDAPRADQKFEPMMITSLESDTRKGTLKDVRPLSPPSDSSRFQKYSSTSNFSGVLFKKKLYRHADPLSVGSLELVGNKSLGVTRVRNQSP